MRSAVLLVLADFLLAQTPQPKLAYEVASIKGNADSSSTRWGFQTETGGRIRATNVPLRILIVIAYGASANSTMGQDFTLAGGPGWISTEGFDVDARPPEGLTPTAAQTQEMLQALLAERFQLKVRRETRDGPAYALVTAKGGPKLKPSPDSQKPGGTTIGRGLIRATHQDLNGLATVLAGQVNRKVVNRTDLTGLYDFELKWMPDPSPPAPGEQPPPPDSDLPSLFTAVEEQLGLRLEPTTAPVDTLVIEHVEQPSAN